MTFGGIPLVFLSKYLDFGPDCVSCLMAKKMAKKGLNGYGLKEKDVETTEVGNEELLPLT